MELRAEPLDRPLNAAKKNRLHSFKPYGGWTVLLNGNGRQTVQIRFSRIYRVSGADLGLTGRIVSRHYGEITIALSLPGLRSRCYLHG